MPATHKTAGVASWRKLQKSGAIQIKKTSTYLLPDTPAPHELFQWLAKQVSDYKGDSTLIRAQQVDRILKGWAKREIPDDEILFRGGNCSDGLYAFLRR
jgi:hypothetical protein